MSKFFIACLNKRDIFINDPFLNETVLKQIRRFDFDCIKNKRRGCFQDFQGNKATFSRYYECWFDNWLETVSKIPVLQNRYESVRDGSDSNNGIKKSSSFVLANGERHQKNRAIDNDYCHPKPDPKNIVRSILFLGLIQLWLIFQLFLRGLNRNFSLQTKFYSCPRRPFFLGALGKAEALLAPRACLKTMLLQAFTSRFIAWSQYLCIAKFSSHLFRTRSGRIGQRRCFLFRKSVGNKRMSRGLCDVSM